MANGRKSVTAYDKRPKHFDKSLRILEYRGMSLLSSSDFALKSLLDSEVQRPNHIKFCKQGLVSVGQTNIGNVRLRQKNAR